MEPEFVSHEEMFHSIIEDIEDLIKFTRKDKLDLEKARLSLKKQFEKCEITELTHSIESERLSRAQKNIEDSLKDLHRQKELALRTLRDLQSIDDPKDAN